MATFGEFSKKEVEKMADDLSRTKGRITKMKEKATEMVGVTIGIAETAGAGFGMAYLRGRYQAGGEAFEVGGLPIDLLAAGAGHILAFSGLFGKYAEHIHNLATGALTEYAAVEGLELGTKAGAMKFGGGRIPTRVRNQMRHGMPSQAYYTGMGQVAQAA